VAIRVNAGEQALMRGLDTAFPFSSGGCRCHATALDRVTGRVFWGHQIQISISCGLRNRDRSPRWPALRRRRGAHHQETL